MRKLMKVLLFLLLFVGVVTQDHICEHLGFGQSKFHDERDSSIHQVAHYEAPVEEKENYLVSDTVFSWNEQSLNWEADSTFNIKKPKGTNSLVLFEPIKEPVDLEWYTLMNIQYQLKYFAQIDMEMYAPVFPDSVLMLDGKEVIIEGFVIPFEEDGAHVSLSFNPYASCFFCGKASPASVLSMYLKNKKARYAIDAFKKFKGKLRLNHDDPDEFYYILEDAKEVKK